MDLGWVPHASRFLLSVRILTLLFSDSSSLRRNRSLRPIAVQPRFSTIHCLLLDQTLLVCYSLPCLFTLSLEVPSSIPADLAIPPPPRSLSALAHLPLPATRQTQPSAPFLFNYLRIAQFTTHLFSYRCKLMGGVPPLPDSSCSHTVLWPQLLSTIPCPLNHLQIAPRATPFFSIRCIFMGGVPPCILFHPPPSKLFPRSCRLSTHRRRYTTTSSPYDPFVA